MSDASSARKGLFIPVVAALGVFAVFLVLLQIARSPGTPVANAANTLIRDRLGATCCVGRIGG